MVILNWGHAKRLFRAVTISDIGFKTDKMPIGSFSEDFCISGFVIHDAI
jgi:hypothetical protein